MNLKGIKLTWLGHATFRIETPGGKIVIIDPWVMGNPKCPDSEKQVKKVDILLCTHGHGDHIGDAVEIARQHNPVVVTVEWGPATPQIFQAVATNEVLKSVVIEFIRTGATGVQEVYQTIRLTNATVSSVRMHVNEPQPGGPADNRALADVAFAFQRIEIENRPGKTMAVDDWAR